MAARELKKTQPTCFVLIRQDIPENTTVEVETIRGIFTTLHDAQKAKAETFVFGNTFIREYVMNPPVIKGDFVFGDVLDACSADCWELHRTGMRRSSQH